jgi:hypothetical protein
MDYPETCWGEFPEISCGVLDNPSLTDQTVHGFHAFMEEKIRQNIFQLFM